MGKQLLFNYKTTWMFYLAVIYFFAAFHSLDCCYQLEVWTSPCGGVPSAWRGWRDEFRAWADEFTNEEAFSQTWERPKRVISDSNQ